MESCRPTVQQHEFRPYHLVLPPGKDQFEWSQMESKVVFTFRQKSRSVFAWSEGNIKLYQQLCSEHTKLQVRKILADTVVRTN